MEDPGAGVQRVLDHGDGLFGITVGKGFTQEAVHPVHEQVPVGGVGDAHGTRHSPGSHHALDAVDPLGHDLARHHVVPPSPMVDE
jgi:hypothetical protein